MMILLRDLLWSNRWPFLIDRHWLPEVRRVVLLAPADIGSPLLPLQGIVGA